jgi:ribulose-phosphate 3-epimerase
MSAKSNAKKMIAPSILSADFTRLAEELRAVEDAGADMIHVDVMDGHFVPNITIGPFIVEAVKRATSLPLDVHLMITNPEKYIKDFAEAGSDIITIHAEATKDLKQTLGDIKKLGKKAGVSINPGTPVSAIKDVIEEADLILVMSVNPGFGGQSFIEDALDKIKNIRAILDEANSEAILEVDGGIKISNIKNAGEAGAELFVAGSAVFGSDNYKETITEMKKELALSSL